MRTDFSISGLMKRSLQYNYSTDTPFSTWLDIADCFLEESVTSLRSNCYEKAYVDVTRFIDLILNKLPSHPEFHLNEHYEHLKQYEIPEALSTSGVILSILIKQANTPPYEVYSATMDVNNQDDLMKFINDEDFTLEEPTNDTINSAGHAKHNRNHSRSSIFSFSRPSSSSNNNSNKPNSKGSPGINMTSSAPVPNAQKNSTHSNFYSEDECDVTFASPLTPERTTFALTNTSEPSLYEFLNCHNNNSSIPTNHNNPVLSNTDNSTLSSPRKSRRKSSTNSISHRDSAFNPGKGANSANYIYSKRNTFASESPYPYNDGNTLYRNIEESIENELIFQQQQQQQQQNLQMVSTPTRSKTISNTDNKIEQLQLQQSPKSPAIDIKYPTHTEVNAVEVNDTASNINMVNNNASNALYSQCPRDEVQSHGHGSQSSEGRWFFFYMC